MTPKASAFAAQTMGNMFAGSPTDDFKIILEIGGVHHICSFISNSSRGVTLLDTAQAAVLRDVLCALETCASNFPASREMMLGQHMLESLTPSLQPPDLDSDLLVASLTALESVVRHIRGQRISIFRGQPGVLHALREQLDLTSSPAVRVALMNRVF